MLFQQWADKIGQLSQRKEALQADSSARMKAVLEEIHKEEQQCLPVLERIDLVCRA